MTIGEQLTTFRKHIMSSHRL